MKHTSKSSLYIINSLTITTLISGLVLSSTLVSADNDSIVDQINITVPVSCTLSGTGMNTHNAEINNGQYNSTIGETTMKAFCNDNNGFAIYAIGYTDNEDGKNVLTNSTLGSTHDIVTGTALSGDTSNWAMKLSAITSPTPTYPIIIAGSTDDADKEQGDPDYTTFQEVPDDYALVAKRTAGTDIGANAEGTTLKSTYQAYISKTQPAGTYTGQVKYTLVHPHDATKPHKKIYMQDLTSTTIAQLLPNTHDTAIVVDKRDEQEYTIAKLADGKYWMTENLNIAGGTALSSEDTDFDSSYTLPTTGNWTVEDGKLVLPTSTTSWSSPDSSAVNDALVYNSGNKENCGNSGQNIPCYSYYSWDTATLGSGRSLMTENTDAPYSICPKGWRLPTSGNWENGEWKRGDFYALATAYESDFENSMYESSSTLCDNAGPNTVPNFILAGNYTFTGNANAGSSGVYWSSTASSDTSAVRAMSIYTNSSSIASQSNRQNGESVRCLFKTN